jgi:hypothetical protein
MARLRLLAACLVLAAAGCGGEEASSGDEGAVIDWDLSGSHTVEDVDWPRPELTAVEIKPTGELSIRLPEDKSLNVPDGVVHDVSMDRRGDTVREILVDSHPRSREDAYELAVEWAREWGLSVQPFDDWRDGKTKTPVVSGGTDAQRVGADGPIPSVEIRNSFRDDRPALASLSLFWPS